MAWQVKAPVSTFGDLRSIPGTQGLEGVSQLLKAALQSHVYMVA